MDSSVLSDDSEYDFISNASVSDDAALAPITEPPPSAAAQDKFNTVALSPEDCMAMASRSLGIDTSTQTRTRRIYVDGVFNGLSVRDALQLRQIKLSFPSVILVAGVFSDATCELFGISVAPQVERCEVVRHARWVDEVLDGDAPCPIDSAFVSKHNFDLVAVEEGATVDPAYHKLRLAGYDDMKRAGIVLPTRRTTGTVMSTPPTPAPRTPLAPPLPVYHPEEDEQPHMDIYGIGF